jgi:hypothetical protein
MSKITTKFARAFVLLEDLKPRAAGYVSLIGGGGGRFPDLPSFLSIVLLPSLLSFVL